MPRPGHRRQFILFLAAILVPCLVLIVLSLRVIGQDLELREDLRTRLEAIRRDEIRTDLKPGGHYRHAEVAFVDWLEEERLMLPWERVYARRSRDLLARASFSARLQECERAEFGPDKPRARPPATNRRWPRREIQCKRPTPVFWARTLDRAGQHAQAAALFQGLLSAPPDVTDEEECGSNPMPRSSCCTRAMPMKMLFSFSSRE